MKPFSADLIGDSFASKALDNRVSFLSMIVALKELQNINHDADIYFVATVQEETHLTGGIISSFNIAPDLAIVVDVCHADSAEAEKELTQKIGGGPSVSLGPTFSK